MITGGALQACGTAIWHFLFEWRLPKYTEEKLGITSCILLPHVLRLTKNKAEAPRARILAILTEAMHWPGSWRCWNCPAHWRG